MRRGGGGGEGRGEGGGDEEGEREDKSYSANPFRSDLETQTSNHMHNVGGITVLQCFLCDKLIQVNPSTYRRSFFSFCVDFIYANYARERKFA